MKTDGNNVGHGDGVRTRKGERCTDRRQRPTNLKRSRGERVSWGEAEVKSTVTVPLLQRRHKGQHVSRPPHRGCRGHRTSLAAGAKPTLSLSLVGAAALPSLGSAGHDWFHTERDRTASQPDTGPGEAALFKGPRPDLTIVSTLSRSQNTQAGRRNKAFYPTPTKRGAFLSVPNRQRCRRSPFSDSFLWSAERHIKLFVWTAGEALGADVCGIIGGEK